MYDSDEVREAVRQEMGALILKPRWLERPLSAAERAALDEARTYFAAELQKALQAVMEERQAALERWAAAVLEKMRESMARFAASLAEIGEAELELLKRAMATAAEAIKNFGLEIGILQEREDTPPPWKRHPREPEIRPVLHIDAVAAGRHPAMIQRTQIRGGRR